MAAKWRPAAQIERIRELARRLWNMRATLGLAAMLAFAGTLAPQLVGMVAVCWQSIARAAQLRPEDCNPIWLLQWGRGAGKTRAASEHTLDVMELWGPKFSGCLISKTIEDVITTMINDPGSGLLACAQRRGYELAHYPGTGKHGSKYLRHPSGALLYYRAATQPNYGRGLNLNFFWADEISSWPRDALGGFMAFFAAWRIPAPTPSGEPIAIITTTPKVNAIMKWLRSPDQRGLVTITRQSSRDNAGNIRIDRVKQAYGGTPWEAQEIDGEMLDEAIQIAQSEIDDHRSIRGAEPENLRIVVAVDPAGEDNATADACGIVGVGADMSRLLPEAYVLEDETVQGKTPRVWARRATELAKRLGACKIIVEKNYGGLMPKQMLELAMEDMHRETGEAWAIPVEGLYHGTDKRTRAAPAIALTQQGRVHFAGKFEPLEKEITTWVEGDASPNRMDAWAMAITDLLLPVDTPVGPMWTPF